MPYESISKKIPLLYYRFHKHVIFHIILIECVKRCSPPKDGSKPVCDSKGGIHDSVCMFKNAKCIDDSLRRVKCRPGK